MGIVAADALKDPLQRWDPLSQELAYNNFTDRMKIELPEYSDPASSGCVQAVLPFLGSALASGMAMTMTEASNFVTKSLDFKPAQTASGIWTPAVGKKFAITDMIVSAGSTGVVHLYDSINDDNHRVVKLFLAANQVFEHSYNKAYVSNASNNVLKYDSQAGCSGNLVVSGYEL